MTVGSIAERELPGATTKAGELLSLVRRGEAVTISELAASLGLARSTVQSRVDMLMSGGMLRAQEATSQRRRRGRPPVAYAFDPSAGYALVVHLGVSATLVGVADLSGSLLRIRRIDTPLGDCSSLMATISTALAEELMAAGGTGESVHGLAVGRPGWSEVSASLPAAEATTWSDDAILEGLSMWADTPVYVQRDVDLIAVADYWARRDTGEYPDVLLALKIGTYLSAAVLVNGTPLQGASNQAGQLSHIAVPGATGLCWCGRRGCLHTVASGTAVLKRLRSEGLDVESVAEACAMAAAGNPVAGQAIREAGAAIGAAIAPALSLLNPHVLTTWGYLTDAPDPLLSGLRAVLSHELPSSTLTGLTIDVTSLHAQAGLVGGARMVVERALEPSEVDAYLSARFSPDDGQYVDVQRICG